MHPLIHKRIKKIHANLIVGLQQAAFDVAAAERVEASASTVEDLNEKLYSAQSKLDRFEDWMISCEK